MTVLRALSIGAATLALVVAGCSSADEPSVMTIRQTTENLIRADVADGAGLGDLTPTCPEITVAAVGTTFECTASTGDQRIVSLLATIDELGHIDLATTNLITGPALPSFERAAVGALNTTVGSNLTDDAIDCGDSSVVFGQEMVMVCALLDPHTQKVFDVSLTMTDIEARQFSLVVADQPRA